MTEAGIGAVRGGWQMPRWSVALLTASLALNLIVVGLVAGSIWRARAHQPPDRPLVRVHPVGVGEHPPVVVQRSVVPRVT